MVDLTPKPKPKIKDIVGDDGSKQPTAARTVEHGDFDTTSLRESVYEHWVHRDWIAHNVRWGWASRRLRTGESVLEPGCGAETPLLRHLHNEPTSQRPGRYVGVDLNRIRFEDDRRARVAAGKSLTYKWVDLWPETNFVESLPKLLEEYGPHSFDKVVSFEVYEHITPRVGLEYLDACRELLSPGGELLLSTPVFNGKKAANHVREYTADEMQVVLEDRGFRVLERYGTFASYHDVKRGLRERFADDPDLGDALLDVYESCRQFNGDALLAGMLAPILPDHSRNNTWVCELADSSEPEGDR